MCIQPVHIFFTEVDSCHIVSNAFSYCRWSLGQGFFPWAVILLPSPTNWLPFASLCYSSPALHIYIWYDTYVYYIYIWLLHICNTIHFSFDSQKFYLLSSRAFGCRPTFRNGEVNPNGETYPVPWICWIPDLDGKIVEHLLRTVLFLTDDTYDGNFLKYNPKFRPS
jgi:hypothetical protein